MTVAYIQALARHIENTMPKSSFITLYKTHFNKEPDEATVKDYLINIQNQETYDERDEDSYDSYDNDSY